MRVDQGVFDVFTPKYMHDMENVPSAMILHCCFPMAQCVKCYLLQSGLPNLWADVCVVVCMFCGGG
jgi:hypothetical protein